MGSRSAACRRFALATAALVLGPAGCSTLHPPMSGQIPAPQPNGAGTADFRVGAARVDLTPIPGIPMNYSIGGKLSRGFWTRLYVRAVYLQDKNAKAIVLVSCDLPHIPNGLGDRVAELVSEQAPIDHLGRAQIVLAATHTHHGPENFFSDGLYNAFPSPRSGFDPQLFEFLAHKITGAILEAFDDRTPSVKVRYRQARLERFFRNRSLGAFLRNGEAGAFLAGNAALPGDCLLAEDQTDERACRAVRALVEIVEFVDAGNQVIASTVFLAAHPTVLSSQTEVFTGDLFEATSTLLEQKRLGACASYSPPVVALFNGAQGDASVTWRRRDRYELLNTDPVPARLGLAVQLARFICGADPGIGAVGPDVYVDPRIDFQFEWLPLEKPLHAVTMQAQPDCQPWNEHCTVEKPLPGVATMGGAQDGRTLWYEMGVGEGLRYSSRGTQGRKLVEFEAAGVPIKLSELVTDSGPPPDAVPVGIYRIGSLLFATLPGEFTTMMGDRIRGAIEKAAGASASHVLLIGLANGHVSYVTTPEEYDAQFYEGASNLYGAATGPLVQSKLVALTGKTTPSADGAGPYDYDPGACRVFLPRDAGYPAFASDDGLQNILMDLDHPDEPKRDFQKQCWIDAIPKLPDGKNGCVRSVPYVWVEKANAANPAAECTGAFPPDFLARPCDRPLPKTCDPLTDPRFCIGGVPQDNCGLDLVTVLHGSYRDRTRWCAFWMPSASVVAADHRLCVSGVTGANVMQTDGAVGDEDLGLEIDPGPPEDLLGISTLVTRQLECCGVSTRPVCEYPVP